MELYLRMPAYVPGREREPARKRAQAPISQSDKRTQGKETHADVNVFVFTATSKQLKPSPCPQQAELDPRRQGAQGADPEAGVPTPNETMTDPGTPKPKERAHEQM